jgi:hypothetical protein
MMRLYIDYARHGVMADPPERPFSNSSLPFVGCTKIITTGEEIMAIAIGPIHLSLFESALSHYGKATYKRTA